jgi:phospholipase/lecithinase/hemolysin
MAGVALLAAIISSTLHAGADMDYLHRRLRLIATLLVLWMLPTAASAQIPQFDFFYTFGDSLADNGNVFLITKALGINPAVPPSEQPFQSYFAGRFSNGYVGFEYLWQHLSGHAPGSEKGLTPFLGSFHRKPRAVDFAFGGTGTPRLDQTQGGLWAPGLKGQVDLFGIALRGKKPSKDALYAIVTGANDYSDNPFNIPMHPTEVVQNIIQSIVRLYLLGARHVMVLDLPDLGLIPANSGNPGPASQISALHNLLLENALNDLQAHLPKLHLVPVKLEPLFNALRTSLEPNVPALAVFAPPNGAVCLFVNPALCTDVSPILFNNLSLGFLFWDIVHPTAEAHRALADYLYEQLANSY